MGVHGNGAETPPHHQKLYKPTYKHKSLKLTWSFSWSRTQLHHQHKTTQRRETENQRLQEEQEIS